ncbi:hypothetical protein PCARR_a2690 [Pseudoalteromonas carrageenovora IAM 12662]|uniref:Uncharacterized protein n=1 Tax=Pseudoalteromonas carrageenovora IAM 12662 TaxID=1314868 RepID=A0ABR9EM97_PSEVC|nr:hypothetical protein [Pseudoalteromonas carrageenovora IAM 12662]
MSSITIAICLALTLVQAKQINSINHFIIFTFIVFIIFF